MAKEKGKEKEAGVATAPEAQPAEAPTATFGPPPPIRRIVVEEEPTIVAPPPPGAVPPARANGSAPGQGINRLASAHPPTEVVERMRTSDLRRTCRRRSLIVKRNVHLLSFRVHGQPQSTQGNCQASNLSRL